MGVYAHDRAGGLFANLEEAKKKNDAGVFHFKLCHPERTEEAFPCNEWKQSSNPVLESTVTGFEAVRLTWPLRSDHQAFGGLMKSNPGHNLMDDDPSGVLWWNSVGTIFDYHGKIPGPVGAGKNGITVMKKQLFVYK